MKIESIGLHYFDHRDTMYPCAMYRIDTTRTECFDFVFKKTSTLYGYVLQGTLNSRERTFRPGFFCLPLANTTVLRPLEDTVAMVITRFGYQGQDVSGAPVKGAGRLTYIDGCSDSLLVYPPRAGDPSLNHLHFPSFIDQTEHVHPSIRLGMVINGEGLAHYKQDGVKKTAHMQRGSVFALGAQEKHKFETTSSEMDIIAFHPDGDWGPRDHDHTMLNRTYK